MPKYEMTGAVRAILDLQTFASGFSKREFVIETRDKYPQMIKLECVKDKTQELEKIQVGDVVDVSFDIRGSEYKDRFYVNLVAWKIEATGETDEGPRDVPASEARMKHQQAKGNAYQPQDDDEEGDSIPF